LPYHRYLDQAQEQKREAGRIGTTCRGIGPCYVDKFNRRGIRICDLFHESVLKEKLAWNIYEKSFILEKFYNFKAELNEKDLFDTCLSYAHALKKYVNGSTTALLAEAVSQGKNILLEGAQGTMLDVDHGTYPFVTSSNPTSGGACTGAGVGPKMIDEVLGVAKAYVTRVGEGPFPTMIQGELEEKMREWGGEFGATTGRPRKCGWFDAVVLRHAAGVNSLTSLAITKLDVLDNLDEILVCEAYEIDGKRINYFPTDLVQLDKAKPVYKKMKGWKKDTTGIRDYSELPAEAKAYLEELSRLVGVPTKMISIGAKRNQIIHI
jgi:adenylosuccinate synthase